jgi:hypothetical protein
LAGKVRVLALVIVVPPCFAGAQDAAAEYQEPKDERDFYCGHAAGDLAATYGQNWATTLSDWIQKIPNPAPCAVELAP